MGIRRKREEKVPLLNALPGRVKSFQANLVLTYSVVQLLKTPLPITIGCMKELITLSNSEHTALVSVRRKKIHHHTNQNFLS